MLETGPHRSPTGGPPISSSLGEVAWTSSLPYTPSFRPHQRHDVLVEDIVTLNLPLI